MISNFNSKNKEHSKLLSFLVALFIVGLAVLIVGIATMPNIKTNAASNTSSNIRGDVDMNGKITSSDARLALRAAVGLEDYAPGSDKFIRADYDSNGKITAGDARMILRTAVELEPLKYLNEEVPESPEEPTEPEDPVDNHTITLSDGRVIPDNTPDWDKEFSYNGKSEKDLYTELILCGFDYDVLATHYPNYSCGCKNHKCRSPLEHFDMVHDEILGCTICGSHECMRLYTGNDADCSAYVPPKYPDNCCQTCGKLLGDGTNGTCCQFLRDKECPRCGEFVTAWTCHTCKGH